MKLATTRTVAALAAVGLLLGGATGCAAKRKRKEAQQVVLTVDAQYHKGLELLEKRDLRKARTTLERVEFTPDSRIVYEPLVKLAIADATFWAGDDLSLIDARSLYLDFVTLYGDHPLAPYAQLQAGVCSLLQVNSPSRDQSETRVAMQDLETVLKRYPTSRWAPLAREKIREAERSLAEHEFLVGRFYIKRKRYLAGTQRLRGLLNDFPEYAAKDKVYFYLAKGLIKGDNDAEGKLYLETLLADFPQTEYAKRARELLLQIKPGDAASSADGKPRG